jgi:hypothetical protein
MPQIVDGGGNLHMQRVAASVVSCAVVDSRHWGGIAWTEAANLLFLSVTWPFNLERFFGMT